MLYITLEIFELKVNIQVGYSVENSSYRFECENNKRCQFGGHQSEDDDRSQEHGH